MIQDTTVTIFGATGFIGQETVRRLAREGFRIRLAHRYPRACDFLKTNGQVGQIVPEACDFTPEGIARAVTGSGIVINCTGILYETRRRTFMATHRDFPETIAKACKTAKVRQFIHISALGIDASRSRYAASKREGEKAVQKAFDRVTILRPSIVFGPKDRFFNRFAGLARLLPALPLIGGGKTRFQPVFVGDVAQAVIESIRRKVFGVYQLGGPEVLDFKALMQKMMQVTGRSVALVPLPFWVAGIQGRVLGLLPRPPLTRDQVISLKTDSIVAGDAPGLKTLGVTPTPMDAVLPTYLDRFR